MQCRAAAWMASRAAALSSTSAAQQAGSSALWHRGQLGPPGRDDNGAGPLDGEVFSHESQYGEVIDKSWSDTPEEMAHFVAECNDWYRSHGWLHIPHFLSSATTAALATEAQRLLADPANQFRSTETHTVFQEDQDPTLGPSHPFNAEQSSSKVIVDYGRLPATANLSPLRALYTDTSLLNFVGGCVGVPELHRSACEYNAAYYNEFGQGDGLGWHFDRSRFGVNLVLQQPGAGGDFQIHHNTRTELDMYPFGTVGKILGGDLSEVVTVGGVGAGSLVLFSGRSSLHRVTPITASPPRINTILTFEEQPGQKANSYALQKFFGR